MIKIKANTLEELLESWEQRRERYKEKQAKATGTDVINQGAKIKATTECIDGLRAFLITKTIS